MQTFHLTITRLKSKQGYTHEINVFSLRRSRHRSLYFARVKNDDEFFEELTRAIVRLKDATEYGSV